MRRYSSRWMLPLLVAALSSCGALKLAAPLTPKEGDWCIFGGSAVRGGVAQTTLLPPLQERWAFDIAAGTGPGSPIIVDSTLLQATLRGDLYALDAVTGRKLGRLNFNQPIAGSPAVNGFQAILGLGGPQGSLLSYDLVRGTTEWQHQHGDIAATPLILDQNVFVGTLDGRFLCASIHTGELLWEFTLPENVSHKGIRSSAAATESTLVFGADDGAVYALNAQTGVQRWRVMTRGPVLATPALRGDIAVAASTGGTVHAIALATGERRWMFDAASPITASAVIADSCVAVFTSGGSAFCLDLQSGSIRWATSLNGPISGGAILAGSHLYVATQRRELLALALTTGTVVWRTQLTGRGKSALAAASGRIYVATDDQLIHCFTQEVP